MSRIPTIALASAVLVVGWSAGCDKPPTQPTRNTSTTSVSSQPTLQSISVEGPTSVPPGTTAKFSAIGQWSDGTTEDVTSTTGWRSSDSAVLNISASGEAVGGKPGEVVVSAQNNSRRASLDVLVLAPGTFRLTGLVSDSGVPVSGATVDVLDGSRALMSARTDAQGIYRLYGLAGPVELRVRADGYPDQVRGIPVSDDARLDFTLPPGEVMAGAYELAIIADDRSCPLSARNPFPPDLRTRMYDAVITQDGLQLSVKLAGASLRFGSFSGMQNGTTATFDIHGITTDPYYHYYTYIDRTLDLVEQLSATSYLLISGRATVSKVSGGLSGQLDGVIGTLGTISSSYANFTASCWGRQTFVLRRR